MICIFILSKAFYKVSQFLHQQFFHGIPRPKETVPFIRKLSPKNLITIDYIVSSSIFSSNLKNCFLASLTMICNDALLY